MALTIDLNQNVGFLFSSRVLSHQCVFASVIAVDLINDECCGRAGDFNKSSVVEVNIRLTPCEGGHWTASNLYEQTEGAASTQADGLLQVIVQLKVRSFCVSKSK